MLTVYMAASCIDTQTGDETGIVKDPVSECVMPGSAHCGEEVILQWNGFSDDASIILRSVSGEDSITEIKVITGSGLIFLVPFSSEPGDYDVFLIQEGSEFLLGRLSVFAPVIPVNGISVPSSCLAGESMTIKGTGFKPDSDVKLTGTDGTEYEVETVYVAGGLTFVIPEDMPEGEYTVSLVQDGYTWVISDSLIISSIPAKALASVAYQGPYMGSTRIMYTWSITEDDPMRVLLFEEVVNADGSLDQGVHDEYTAISESGFELTVDGFETSNDLSMTYDFDSDGRIASSYVLIYGKSKETEFSWSYDEDGYLLDVTYMASTGLRVFRDLSYEDGNLVRFRNTSFEYSDPSLVNGHDAPDVVWGYMAVMEKFDPFMFFPYLLGWYDMKSSCLPTAMTYAAGTGTITVPLEYVFDEDGYVIEMIWVDGGVNQVIFTYR